MQVDAWKIIYFAEKDMIKDIVKDIFPVLHSLSTCILHHLGLYSELTTLDQLSAGLIAQFT